MLKYLRCTKHATYESPYPIFFDIYFFQCLRGGVFGTFNVSFPLLLRSQHLVLLLFFFLYSACRPPMNGEVFCTFDFSFIGVGPEVYFFVHTEAYLSFMFHHFFRCVCVFDNGFRVGNA